MSTSLLLVACFVLSALSVGLASTPTECEGLPSQWKSYTESTCVWVSTERGSFSEAREWCRSRRSLLVRIYDQETNDRITEIIQESNPKGKKTFWIGLDRVTLDEFRWVFGQSLTYQNFVKNSQKENCVTIDQDGGWGTDRCDKELPFICHIRVNK